MSRTPEEIIAQADAWCDAFWHGTLSPHGDHGSVIAVIELARQQHAKLNPDEADSRKVAERLGMRAYGDGIRETNLTGPWMTVGRDHPDGPIELCVYNYYSGIRKEAGGDGLVDHENWLVVSGADGDGEYRKYVERPITREEALQIAHGFLYMAQRWPYTDADSRPAPEYSDDA